MDFKDILTNTQVWYVSYRGNCFGMFISESMAKEFAVFIKPRIDNKTTVNSTHWFPYIHKISLLEFLTLSNTITPYTQPVNNRNDVGDLLFTTSDELDY